jgi:hypothetical protein
MKVVGSLWLFILIIAGAFMNPKPASASPQFAVNGAGQQLVSIFEGLKPSSIPVLPTSSRPAGATKAWAGLGYGPLPGFRHASIIEGGSCPVKFIAANEMVTCTGQSRSTRLGHPKLPQKRHG